jgi:UDP-N-acetylglucosamine enolpyruvyl transferase
MSEDYVERLHIVAKGRVSTTKRVFEGRTKYLPTVAGMICQISQEEEDCFVTSKAALKAAIEFQIEAVRRLTGEA